MASDCTSCDGNTDETATTTAAGCGVLRKLSLLQDVSSVLAQGLELREAMHAMFRQCTDATGLQRGLLTILNRETGALMVAEKEDGPGASHDVVAKVGEGLLGRVAAQAEPLTISDLGGPLGALPPAERSLLQPAIVAREALIAVPIRHAQEVLGTLSFTRPTTGTYSLENDARFLALLAGQVGLAVRFRQIAKERLETLQLENERLQDKIKKSFVPDGMVGHSSALRMVYFHVDQVADSKTTVLIRGETGCGKERVAQAIWQGGNRRSKPYVRINCAALPDSIIESELFGHEKGAFTGALALRKGRFELAHTGTIFLDEIGEISPATPAMIPPRCPRCSPSALPPPMSFSSANASRPSPSSSPKVS